MRAGETPLLNRTEQVLYGRLMRAFPGHIILAQAALARLGIEQSVAHFLILRADFTSAAAVQLEELVKPHEGKSETERCLESALHAAGVRVLRVSAADMPSDAALRAMVAALPLTAIRPPMKRASARAGHAH
jgi:hypothetical protein